MRALFFALVAQIAMTGSADASAAETCEMLQIVGSRIMEERQNGVTMKGAVDRAVGTMAEMKDYMPEEQFKAMSSLMLSMVKMAYEAPLERTDRGAEVVAIEFGESIYVECITR